MSEKSGLLNDEFQNEIGAIDFEQIEEVARVFQQESEEILNELDGLILRVEEDPNDQDRLNVLFRKVHTIKGSVGAVPGGQLLGSLSHEFEALLMRVKQEERVVSSAAIELFLKSSRLMKVLASSLYEKREIFPEELSEAIELIASYGNFTFSNEPDGVTSRRTKQAREVVSNREQGVWLPMEEFDSFLRLSGELLVLKNYFNLLSQTVNMRENPELFEKKQTEFSRDLGKISDLLQTKLQGIRKEKAGECLQSLPLLIRQASTELNKPVHYQFDGMDIPLDVSLGQDLQECLVHLIRNSIDHGIEDQFERAVQGKSSNGNLNLQIQEGPSTYKIIYRDDGRGLDKDRILQKALKLGLASPEKAATLSEGEIFKFIFEPGFSTKEKITTISGRGVGMDIVHSLVMKYQGQVEVQSTSGQGTQFMIEIPFLKHILVESALICTWSSLQMAVPLTSIATIASCSDLQLTEFENLRYCQFKGMTVPLLTYPEYCTPGLINLNVKSTTALIIRSQQNYFGLIVDKVEAQTELVLKEFSALLRGQKGFKGLSILPDERVTYVVEPAELFNLLKEKEKSAGVAA